jgi:hypothetical protein
MTLAAAALPLIQKYIEFKEKAFAHERDMDRAYAQSSLSVLVAFLAFIVALVIVVGFLTWDGKVSSDALLLLLGTTAGFCFSVIYRQLFPPGGDSADAGPSFF